MAKITVSEDCGNSPKKLHLKKFNIAFVKNDRTFINQNVTDDISWNMVGEKHRQGKEQVAAELKKMRSMDITELVIHNIITHGYNGTTNGLLKFKGGVTLAFCDVYTFSSPRNNAKIKGITSYVIEVKA
ncbi:nuclear transport factor 2 family protein [Fodinibius salsisoli]|uniref:Nuclear transport factor 2 family protein n=1 Tax=Fodinibius salsisoli TaxID=2820877 RepID=A0ABT3PHZ6_9BACT|nr:nuclear transport factor 2 family protein [Fodinibius salsisoli]MCW9705536.1 nuclear transport factor 2 family protein [Fodinibius salsisoli]